MKNPAVWTVIAVVIVAGGAGWWYYNLPKSSAVYITETATNTMQPIASVTTPNDVRISFVDSDEVNAKAELMLYNQTTNNAEVDLTGWKIESKSTALSYVIPTVTKKTQSGTASVTISPKRAVTYAADYVLVTISGSVSDNSVHEAEGISYRLFTGTKTWNTTHDTITVRDASGKVMGTLVY